MHKLISTIKSHDVIEASLFGAKMTSLYGPGNANQYTSAMNYLGVSTIRIGDEYAKHFDVSRPHMVVVDNTANSSPELSEPTVSVAEALDWAHNNGRPVVVNIPTNNLFMTPVDLKIFTPRAINFSEVSAVKEFVRQLLTKNDTTTNSLADAKIDAIEIGNEYWNSDLTSREYGNLANILATEIQSVIDSMGIKSADQPKILIQMGSPWAREFEANAPFASLPWTSKIQRANQDILSQISPFARGAIDGLVEHYYYVNGSDDFSFTSQNVRNIDSDWGIWAANGFQDKDLYITEWNNKQSNTAQFGLKGASVMIEQIENMLRLGVDAACVWPLQHGLTNLVDRLHETPLVTPRGEAFRLMAESLPGLRLIQNNLTTSNGLNFEINAFGSTEKYVFFVSSRTAATQEISIDLSDIVPEGFWVSATKIGIDRSTADGFYDPDGDPLTPNNIVVPDYQDPDARASLTTLRGLGAPNIVNIHLDAFEVLHLVFIPLPQIDIGSNRIAVFAQGNFEDDCMMGSARAHMIRGLAGNYYLRGGANDDILDGGIGSDTILGGAGQDQICGGDGNDSINGGENDDVFDGGQGEDYLNGGLGHDIIWGKEGNDFIFAGYGSDTVFGGSGDDTILGQSASDVLSGGLGNDTFRYRDPSEGGDIIVDFGNSAESNDRFSFYANGFGSSLAAGRLPIAKFVTRGTESNLLAHNGGIDSDDRFVFNTITKKLYFDADGSGRALPTLIATLHADAPDLSAGDIFLF